jgi:hypothetical protein
MLLEKFQVLRPAIEPEDAPNEKGRHCWRPLKIFHRVEEKQRSWQRS